MTNEQNTGEDHVSEQPLKLIMEKYANLDVINKNHAGHAFSTDVLLEIEKHISSNISCSAET